MITKWEYSAKTEAKRIIHCAHQMTVEFYRVNNFIVLPHTIKVRGINTVTFPDLPYNKIPRFWDKVKRVEIGDNFFESESKLQKKILNLDEFAKIEKIDFEKTRLAWQKAESEVLNEIYKIIPKKKSVIRKIVILPTAFGTNVSFSSKPTKNGVIYIYLRNDCGIYEITEAIVTSLTRSEIYKNLSGVWQESEIVTDWILTKSALAKFLEKYENPGSFLPTIKGVRVKQQAKLLAKSEDFYKKLGLSINKKVFGLNGLTPEIRKKPVENLSVKEKIILRLLIQKAGSIVTFDEIGENIFKNDDDFSLYAISKSIERLRTKFERNGVSGSFLQTLRGQGYILKS